MMSFYAASALSGDDNFLTCYPNFLMAILKAHCHGCDWLVVMLKSKTKLWPLSNYQAFMLLDHALFQE